MAPDARQLIDDFLPGIEFAPLEMSGRDKLCVVVEGFLGGWFARAMGDRRREGQFLSYLGLLHTRQANFDEARRCLDSSEALLRAVSDRMSLGILLCGRAETEHLAGVSNDAKAALAEANVIAAEVGAGPDSELGLALARVHNLLYHGNNSKVDSPITG